jgi:serine O-acetyltransferase
MTHNKTNALSLLVILFFSHCLSPSLTWSPLFARKRWHRLAVGADNVHLSGDTDGANQDALEQWVEKSSDEGSLADDTVKSGGYDLGIGKNPPVGSRDEGQANTSLSDASQHVASHWVTLDPVVKPAEALQREDADASAAAPKPSSNQQLIITKKLLPRNEETKHLKAAIWDENHYEERSHNEDEEQFYSVASSSDKAPPIPSMIYPDIDLSIPDTVYSPPDVDIVWDTLRYEAFREAEREPLLVSFMYSTILNHDTLESALAFHLANLLSSPAMISTQIQSLILEALDHSPKFRRSLRADMMAVRDRDPACNYLPDVFLYFKGFHALQTHRVAHHLYKHGRQVVAHYLQSQVSQTFQIDIHPNATIGSGVMMDHGTGIVVGETARIGHNCSILHHVTLGGSGKKGVDRHPKVGDGVLLGAGASVLGNVEIGDGCQVGAGTLVISDLPPHSVAVGVPAKIIGSFVDVTAQPGIKMNQMAGTGEFQEGIITFESSNI